MIYELRVNTTYGGGGTAYLCKCMEAKEKDMFRSLISQFLDRTLMFEDGILEILSVLHSVLLLLKVNLFFFFF